MNGIFSNTKTVSVYDGSYQVSRETTIETVSHESVRNLLLENQKYRNGNYWAEVIFNDTHTRFTLINGELSVRYFTL
jgi:hypothetical protein